MIAVGTEGIGATCMSSLPQDTVRSKTAQGTAPVVSPRHHHASGPAGIR